MPQLGHDLKVGESVTFRGRVVKCELRVRRTRAEQTFVLLEIVGYSLTGGAADERVSIVVGGPRARAVIGYRHLHQQPPAFLELLKGVAPDCDPDNFTDAITGANVEVTATARQRAQRADAPLLPYVTYKWRRL